MIEFSCPSCRATLKAAESSANSKVACGRCGQRLLVPTPALRAASRTILGELLDPPEERLPVVGPALGERLSRSRADENEPTSGECHAASMVYVAAIVGHALGLGLLPGFVWWLWHRSESRFVDHHGKQLANLFVTSCLVGCLAILLALGGFAAVDVHRSAPLAGIAACLVLTGGYLFFAVAFLIASVFEAQEGDWYKMPIAIQFFRASKR